MGKVSDRIAGLVPNWLHPHDHVSIYSLDCKLARSADGLPAEASTLKQVVKNAFTPWRNRTPVKHTSLCGIRFSSVEDCNVAPLPSAPNLAGLSDFRQLPR